IGALLAGSFGFVSAYGTVSLPDRITGQPSTQCTGNKNVSRPTLYESFEYGRVPRKTAHHSPFCVSTKSAWPVEVTGKGRAGSRWRCVRIGLPAYGAYGPSGDDARNTTSECCSAVPPSAQIR